MGYDCGSMTKVHRPLLCREEVALDECYVAWTSLHMNQASYKHQTVVLTEDQHQATHTHTLNRPLSV